MIKVVSCFWNAENYIEKCINSVKNQIHKNFKMYLVDDVSTDNTVNKIKKLLHLGHQIKTHPLINHPYFLVYIFFLYFELI